jgi:hypothetical protein
MRGIAKGFDMRKYITSHRKPKKPRLNIFGEEESDEDV